MTTVSDHPITRPKMAPPVTIQKPPTWNTKDLGLRLGVDVASAATAGALTCPLITIIDRAIIEKASKGFPIRQTLTNCVRSMVSKPSGFFLSTPFILIYTLYSATYLTANAIDTLSSTLRDQSYSTVTADARFAKIFGANPPPTQPSSGAGAGTGASSFSCHPPMTASAPKIPKVSYGLFCLRDSITIFASFNVPSLIAPSIPDFIAETSRMKATIAQFSCPALMQFASTPMHLLGLDLYNRQPPGGLPWGDRAARIRRDYISSSFARMGKIVPAYGVGGVVNVRMRAALMAKLEKN
ncbi:uncharacterized protein N7483_005684 [Penicillium malachiteum]|uniref:uncharacterized protein n=1 Tax=Penicillium malachiteum TaxID=1324776 RepID=UPI002548E995|nr:uncharacterized protein N7483_005684 [Penicillium malachiteum]KAJ5731176.1 hypothetical protein N7483_005684 [Penicillium malachiteum]